MDKHDTLLLACGSSENRKLLRSILEESYYLLEAVNMQQAILLLEQNLDCIAAVLLDITVPEKVDLDAEMKNAIASYQDKVPMIIISSDDSSEMLASAFARGATDVIPIQYDHYSMQRRIENIVQLNLHKRHLETLVQEQAAVLRHSNDMMVDALSSIIEYRSVESGQHILRIRRFTRILLEEVVRSCPEYGLTEETIGIISSAAALHDIGKISIPDAVLTKPGKLSADEWEIMKMHAITGCRILESLSDVGNQEYLRYAHNICHYHHERWDGGGYPEGIAGEDIPICAQVVGIADVYDALISKRVYKEAYSFHTAVNMILNGECGAFSPKLLECFKQVSGKFEEVAMAYADGLSPKEEKFDVTLPDPVHTEEVDSLHSVQGKYQALLHYINAFIMEINVDREHFHMLYNPYPEFAILRNVNTFAEMEQIILEKIVVSEERTRMSRLIHSGIRNFLDEDLRKQTFFFRMYSRKPEGEALFEITIMRSAFSDTANRTVTVLCRDTEQSTGFVSAAQKGEAAALSGVENWLLPLDTTYCCRNDQGYTLVRMGDEAYSLAGYTAEELRTVFRNQLIELVVPEDREMLRQEFAEQLSRTTLVELEHRIRCKDGRIVWVLNKSRLVVENGQEYLYCMLINITATKKAYDVLNHKLSRYEIILAQTENTLFEWDIKDDTITFSDTWEKIFGYQPISGKVWESLQSGSFFHPDDLPLIYDRIAAMENGSPYEMLEVRIATDQGRYLWFRFRATAIRDAQGNLIKISGIIINVDAEKREEKALQDRAEKDSLTKLLNKHAGRKMAEEYIAQSKKGETSLALLIIDLDDFKLVNDQYGHMFGDAILTQVAREIKKLFRAQDIVARIGGDEFMVVMRGTSDRTLVEKRCRQLLAIFEHQFRREHYNLPLGCSIGIALAPEHGTAYYELFQHADQALYQTKKQGKNSFVFYDEKISVLQKLATAVNNRIDSDEQPGLADANIVQFAFQSLYASEDVDASINEILQLIGQQMNVSRVYIFENDDANTYCSNTYEWCNDGIAPELENLQKVSYITDIPGYEDNFDEHGIFYCPDVTVLPENVYDILAPQGIKSMLQCAFRDNGVFRGYIGFDECVTNRIWTKEQINVLTYFSEMLSVFLHKKRAQEKITQRLSDMGSILDNQNAWIYIIDAETCELKYLNARTRELAPHVQEGMCCYRELMGMKERCPGCPAQDIHRTKNCATMIYNEKFDLHVLAEATLIQWEGRESCLLTCRNLPDTMNYKK